MSTYAADLHIHTVLSPCAEVEMIPPLIVARAIEAGLDMIAVTDHNSCENAQAVIEAAEGTSLRVIPGMECETVEGVHVICLLDSLESAMRMQALVYAALPDMPNRPETFGGQFVVNKEGEFIRHNDRLLLVPCELSIKDVWGLAEDCGGLAIPAHADRPAYGIFGVLGFMPPSPEFAAVEISRRISADEAVRQFPELAGRKLIRSSDAHRLGEIGEARTMLGLDHRTAGEIRKYVSG